MAFSCRIKSRSTEAMYYYCYFYRLIASKYVFAFVRVIRIEFNFVNLPISFSS